MLHADALPAEARFAEDNQPLSGHDHFLDVMQVEPAADKRLAEGVRFAFLQRDFEDLLPTPKALELRLDHFAAEANRLLALLAREAGELAPVLVPPRIVLQ